MELPSGFNARPLALSDLDQTLAVCNAYEVAHLGEPFERRSDIEGFWQRPTFNLASDTRGIFCDGELVAYAEISSNRHADICVHPEHQGKTLGSS